MIIGRWYKLTFDNGQCVTGKLAERAHQHIALDVGGKYKVFTIIDLDSITPIGSKKELV